MKKRLRCGLLGLTHVPPKGYGDGAPYLRIQSVTTDGMNTKHARLYGECQRCGKQYWIASVHLPADEKIMDTMRNLIIERIVQGHIKHGLDEWPSGLRDFSVTDALHIEATAIRDSKNEQDMRAFLEQRTNEELLGMYTQQDCQSFR